MTAVFDPETLATIADLSTFQSLLMSLSPSTFASVKAAVQPCPLPFPRLLQNFLIVSEYRPLATRLVVNLCKLFDCKDALLSFLPRASELSTETVYFLSECISQGIFSSAEACKLLPSDENESSFLAAVLRGSSMVPAVGDDFEEPLRNDDLPAFAEIFGRRALSADTRIAPSILYGCHFLRNRPTLIQYAAFFGSVNCFKFLVDSGASLELKDESGRSLAQFAAAGGSAEIIAVCQSHRCDFARAHRVAVRFHRNAAFPLGRDMLHHCVISNNVSLAAECLKRGDNPNAPDSTGKTPLHLAVQFNSIDAVWLLTRHKLVDVNAVTSDDFRATALHLAVEGDALECARLLLEHPLIDQRVSDHAGRLPIHVAVQFASIDMIPLLLAEGRVSINSRTDYGAPPLHFAVNAGNRELLQFLVGNGADVAAKTLSDETVLHCAARSDQVEALKLLLDCVDDVNPQDADGWTPLHYAIQRNCSATIQALLGDPRIDVSKRTKLGCTALHLAVKIGALPVIEELLALPQTDANLGDNGGWTPLHMASKSGDIAIVEKLLEVAGIKVNVQDKSGWTPLHDAAKYQQHTITARLLRVDGIDVNLKTVIGWTPLHIACLNHDSRTVGMLKEVPGILVNEKDNEGRTPEDLEQIPVFGLELDDARPVDVAAYFDFNGK
jgi:ankyrin repeat protein